MLQLEINNKVMAENIESFEDKTQEENIKLLKEIFELENVRKTLKEKKQETHDQFLQVEGFMFFCGMINITAYCVAGILYLLQPFHIQMSLIIMMIIGVLLWLYVFNHYLTKKVNKEQKEIELNVQNKKEILKIKEKINILKERSFFNISNKNLNKKQLKIEEKIIKLKERLNSCNLLENEIDEFKNESNWYTLNFDVKKLIKQLKTHKNT